MVSSTMNEPRMTPANILIVASYDSANYGLAAIAQELIARGHTVSIVSDGHEEESNIRIFNELHLDVGRLSGLSDADMAALDAVFVPPFRSKFLKPLYASILKHGTMVYSFASLFSSVTMRGYPDITFAIGQNKIEEFQRNCLRYNCVVAGNPQYDGIIKACSHVDERHIKNVLVVDQGAYPYGTEGKQQLATTLVRIAETNPSMEFTIKPRYLPNQDSGAIHKLTEHLYDFITRTPSNLHLLYEATNLEEMIPHYDAMITLWSTSFLDALVADMPLLLLSGFDSVDVFDVRLQRVKEAYDHLQNTGCVYDYHNVSNLEGLFKRADESFCEKEIYQRFSPAAPRIADIVELCHVHLVQQGLRITQHFTVQADEFSALLNSLQTSPVEEPGAEATRNYLDVVNSCLQEFVHRNRCMGSVIDLSPLLRHYRVNFSGYRIRSENLDTYIKQKRKALRSEFEDMVNAFFESDQIAHHLENDAVLQDYYFDWLRISDQMKQLEKPMLPVLAHESQEYNRAHIYLHTRNYAKAYDHLMAFLRAAQNAPVARFQKSRTLATTLHPFKKGRLRIPFYRRLLSKQNTALFDFVTAKESEDTPLISWVKMRRLNAQKRYKECAEYAKRQAVFAHEKASLAAFEATTSDAVKKGKPRASGLFAKLIALQYKKALRHLESNRS